MWYFFPTGIVNLKYTVEGKEIRDLSPTKGNLYIVDHRENQIVDILIMSNESRKIKKTNYLVSGGSSEVKYINYLPKITPYKIINTTEGKTVEKCSEIINNNNNVVIFIEWCGIKKTGIYHILKQTNANAIIIKKKIEGRKFFNWGDKFLDVFGKRQEIKYLDYKYNLKLSPDDFMKELSKILHD